MIEMKRLLFIFDERVTPADLVRCSLFRGASIDLLPLTGNWLQINAIRNALEGIGIGCSVRLLPVADEVSRAVEHLRGKIDLWSKEIAGFPIAGRPLREQFLTSDEATSTYWFTLMSERNPFKDDSFLRIAQLMAVRQIVSRENYQKVTLSLACRSLRRSVIRWFSSCQIPTCDIKNRLLQWTRDARQAFYEWLKAPGYLARLIYRAWLARRILKGVKRAEPDKTRPLFISYFPYCDLEAARRGRFRNKYLLPLQEHFASRSRPIVWLLLFISAEGSTYPGALKMAKKMIRSGEPMFFLEEFVTGRTVWLILKSWFTQLLRYFRLRSQIQGMTPKRAMVDPAADPIITRMFDLSFCGAPAMQGIAFYESFKAMVKNWPGIDQCLYLCEMLSWEKALLGAIADGKPEIRTIGYQHTSISQNHFFYFHPSWKDGSLDARHSMPVPKTLAANGRLTYELLRESGFEGLREVESLRHLHIKTCSPSANRREKPVLLVAGSYNRLETENMLALTLYAFQTGREIDVWLKGHPSCDFRDIGKKFSDLFRKSGFRILDGEISQYLPEATAVLVATSTVSVEAVAYGCKVLIPVFPDMICMCPLLGFEGLFEQVSTPEELRAQVVALSRGGRGDGRPDRDDFVRKYWHLDPDLKLWNQVLPA